MLLITLATMCLCVCVTAILTTSKGFSIHSSVAKSRIAATSVHVVGGVITMLVCHQVASLEAMRGHPAVVPLLEYGITSSISGGRQWVLVFPRYAGSLREWRLKWRGRGLDARDLPVYLRLFLQVCGARLNEALCLWESTSRWMLLPCMALKFQAAWTA